MPGIDPDALVGAWATCRQSKHDIPLAAFMTGCEEVKKIIMTLGSAMSIASSDITEKVGILQKRLDDLKVLVQESGEAPPLAEGAEVADDDKRVRLTLQFMVKHEMAKKVERLESGPYVSGSRSLLRLMWFLDFISVLLTTMSSSASKELKECARDAYEAALAPHHPWIVRKTVSAAMFILPKRETFIRNLAAPNTPESVQPVLAALLAEVEPVRKELWAFYTQHKITDLP